MNPQFFKKYENRKECEEEDSWALEDFDIVETLEKNYISGYYKNQKYAFDPKMIHIIQIMTGQKKLTKRK